MATRTITYQEIEDYVEPMITWLENDTARYIEDTHIRFLYLESKAGFNPDQPRVPRGNRGAGQWTDIPGWQSRLNEVTDDIVDYVQDNPEDIAIAGLSLIPAGAVVSNLTRIIRVWRGARTTINPRMLRIMQSMEKFFDGKPHTFKNKSGDLIMMKGDKKIRFDVANSHGYKPHFHIQKKVGRKWKDMGKHHNYFRD